MKLSLKKFGEILVSRPAGHEAGRVVAAYFKPTSPQEPIELDFAGVKVMTPSWLDEFLQGLKGSFKNKICFLPSENQTVIESLKTLSLD